MTIKLPVTIWLCGLWQNFEVSHWQLCGLYRQFVMSKFKRVDVKLNSLLAIVLVYSSLSLCPQQRRSQHVVVEMILKIIGCLSCAHLLAGQSYPQGPSEHSYLSLAEEAFLVAIFAMSWSFSRIVY